VRSILSPFIIAQVNKGANEPSRHRRKLLVVVGSYQLFDDF
jgi:hypothetical protein